MVATSTKYSFIKISQKRKIEKLNPKLEVWNALCVWVEMLPINDWQLYVNVNTLFSHLYDEIWKKKIVSTCNWSNFFDNKYWLNLSLFWLLLLLLLSSFWSIKSYALILLTLHMCEWGRRNKKKMKGKIKSWFLLQFVSSILALLEQSNLIQATGEPWGDADE